MTEWLRKAGCWFSIAIVLIVTMLSIGCRSFEAEPQFSHSPAFSTDESQDINEKCVFQRGDLVTIVLQDADRPFQQRIKADGTITLSSIGSIVAAGKTAEELQAELAKKDPRFRPRHRYADFVYSVTGEVIAPGPKRFSNGLKVSQAIEAAGGFTKSANKSKVTIVHADGRSETVRLRSHPPDAPVEASVLPGDSITVKRRRLFAR